MNDSATERSSHSVRLTGSGSIQSLGRVRIMGSVEQTALVTPGQKVGTLTLANAKGHVTLRLEVPAHQGAAAPEEQFAFVVQRATGTFRQMTGAGWVALGLGSSAAGAFTLALQPPPSTPGGSSGGSGGGGGTVQPPPTVIASGIRGIALEGPITPVERPGEPNTRPLPGAIITVQPAGGGPELARQQADATGAFQIALDPGTYTIVPLPPDPTQFLPRGSPQEITVMPDQVVDVTVNYDTGIR
jgi:hypothetical protein